MSEGEIETRGGGLWVNVLVLIMTVVLPVHKKQHLPSVSCWAVRASTHSDVYDCGPEGPEGPEGPPLDHILGLAVVVRRVGLSAVLKVVSQHIVPAVLLL